MQSFSVVLPCFNEEQVIASTIQDVASWFQLQGIEGEIVAVDDGSKDGMPALLDALAAKMDCLTVIHHDHNRGYGSAIRTGCDAATKEIIGFMDSDGQFPASEFSKFLPYFATVDMVSGIRVKRADPLMRIVNSKVYRFFINVLFGICVVDLECGMKAFRKDVWPLIRPQYATGAFFDAELFFNAKKNRLVFTEVPVRHLPRTQGHPTGAKAKVILKTLKDLLILLMHGDNVRWLFFPVFSGVKNDATSQV